MGPILTFPKGKERHPNTLKHSGNELPPLGEGWGGALGGIGEGLLAAGMRHLYRLIIFLPSRI